MLNNCRSATKITIADVLSDGEGFARFQWNGPVDGIGRADEDLFGWFHARGLRQSFD